MNSDGRRILAVWASVAALALWVVFHAQYVTDLSAFLPADPTPLQRLLIDQLRDGPTSRSLLIALENGSTGGRARVASAMAERLRRDPGFASVDDGERPTGERDREFLFGRRYLLSDAVDAQHFSAAGLRTAIVDTLDGLASSSGLLLKALLPHDPTGETLRIVERLMQRQGPRTEDGIWTSADGLRTLLVAQTAAAGSDTDAQERAQLAVRSAFAASAGGAAGIRLRMSGPGVFAVAARAKIKNAATRLSLVSSALVVSVLLAVYRSIPVLALGLLPVATGALLGVAAVALGFGAVHGITLGFGVTLIGESVDYSIYFFIQSLRQRSAPAGGAAWRQTLWPTIRLGMLTSVCGFASLLPSGFPGLAQLGLYSISGLIAAALVTRFVLPELLPRGLAIRDLSALGLRLERLRGLSRRFGAAPLIVLACAVAAVATLVLLEHRDTLWNRELAALSPISAADQRYDAMLRADLGAADVPDLLVVSGVTLEAVLRGAERIDDTLQSLIDAGVIGSFDSPAHYLPSRATQEQRRKALPEPAVLLDNLRQATAGLELRDPQLAAFRADVEAARTAALIDAGELRGTSLATGFQALIIHHGDRFSALLPLHAPPGAAAVDTARIARALAVAHADDTQVLDLNVETTALYAGYLHEATRLSMAGFGCIVVLLALALRSPRRVLRVVTPLVLAVLTVAAALVACGTQLTILHLVGMLLIVAVGSNYALFFDQQASQSSDGAAPLTLASLAIANLSTVMGFGLLAFSQVPVLEALGTTVAPGAFAALVYAAVMMPGSRVDTHDA